jgi:hypothetical protein
MAASAAVFVCDPCEGFLQKRGFFRRLFPWAQPDYVLPNITDNNGMKLPGLFLKLYFKYLGLLDA